MMSHRPLLSQRTVIGLLLAGLLLGNASPLLSLDIFGSSKSERGGHCSGVKPASSLLWLTLPRPPCLRWSTSPPPRRYNGTVYRLTASQLVQLHVHGVSDAVLD